MPFARSASRAVAVVLLLLAGCALRGPRVAPGAAASADALLASLATQRAATTSLRARARLRAGLAQVWTREVLLVQRPDHVRIDVLSPFGLALAVGTEGAVLWAYPPSERVRYEGVASPANFARFLGAPVAPADLVDILMGLPPERRPVGEPTVTVEDDGSQRLALPLDDGIQSIWFAPDGRTIVRAEEARQGVLLFRVVFADHQDGFPHTISVAAPQGGAEATLAFDAVERNPVLDPVAFAPPPADRVVPLEGAGAS